MTTVTSVAVQRSGPAIRAVLAERGAPGELECFEGEMRAALTAAVADLDLAGVEEVLSRWHSLAAMTLLANFDQAASASSRRERWLVLVRSRGWPFQ